MGDDDGRGALALGRLLKTGNCQCEIIIPPAKTRNCDSRYNVFFRFFFKFLRLYRVDGVDVAQEMERN